MYARRDERSVPAQGQSVPFYRTHKDEHWLRRSGVGRRVRLLCFPYAGGTAHIFRHWHHWLAPEATIIGVDLPGRGLNPGRGPVDRLSDLMPRLIRVVKPLLDKPIVFFGHGTGALVAFELCRDLRVHGLPMPAHLFVSGLPAPHMVGGRTPLHTLPEDEMINAFRAFSGSIPRDRRGDDQNGLEVLLPHVLRADLELTETYEHEPGVLLDLPITIFGGVGDTVAKREDLEPWSQHTTGTCRSYLLPGSHFFIHEHERLLTAVIQRHIRESVALAGHPLPARRMDDE